MDAIAGLDPLIKSMGPSTRVSLARDFYIVDWLRNGLIDLVLDVMQNHRTPSTLIAGPRPLDMATVANVFFICYEVKGLDDGPTEYMCSCEYTTLRIRKGKANSCNRCQETFRFKFPLRDDIGTYVDRIFVDQLKEFQYHAGEHS